MTTSLPTIATIVATLTCSMLHMTINQPGAEGEDRLSRNGDISNAMQQQIEAREVAGAVTLVADAKSILHLDAVGMANVKKSQEMRPDTICWIASMTKPITGVAVLMMQDAGKLSVDDPVAKFLPEFKQLKNKQGEAAEVTIRQLLTHTSGMSDISPDQAKEAKTLAEATKFASELPVQFEPGTKWSYCQSGINAAARVVEVVSGEKFPVFLEKHLFEPLDMKDTSFYLTSEQEDRLATSYRRTDQGTLEEADNFLLMGKSATSRDRFPAANGGLFSTAGDYVRFCQMLLNNGEFEGKRYLKSDSVKYFSSVLTGDLKTGFTPGNGWGLGCCIVQQPQGATEALASGSYGHGGVYGTQAWIDPHNKLVYILLVQRANFPNADAAPIRQQFQASAKKAFAPK